MGLLPIPYVFNNLPFYTFTFFLTCSVLVAISLSLPICHFFFFCFLNSPQPHSHKPYPQYKTFVNIQAALSSAAFCNNTVFLTTPSSSMHFSSFFDVLPSDPTTTGMTLKLLVFHSFDFSL